MTPSSTVRALLAALVVSIASCNSRGDSSTKLAPAPAPAPVLAPEPALLDEPPHPPPLGSAPPAGKPTEYDEMVECVRAEMSRLHFPMDMTALAVDRIGDWAWVDAQPHQPGTRSGFLRYDSVVALVHKVGGKWTLAELACTEPEGEGCTSNPLYPKVLASRFPGMPLALLDGWEKVPVAPTATFAGQLGDTLLRFPLTDLAQHVPLGPRESFKIVELGRDAHSSHHAVALLGAEPLHRHDTHDLLVVVVEGEGVMKLGNYHERTIGPHSVVYVPRHTVHSMRNTKKKPLIGYAVFTPAFDGKDRVLTNP